MGGAQSCPAFRGGLQLESWGSGGNHTSPCLPHREPSHRSRVRQRRIRRGSMGNRREGAGPIVPDTRTQLRLTPPTSFVHSKGSAPHDRVCGNRRESFVPFSPPQEGIARPGDPQGPPGGGGVVARVEDV